MKFLLKIVAASYLLINAACAEVGVKKAEKIANLKCGEAAVRIQTTQILVPKKGHQVLQQTLVLKHSGDDTATTLPHEGHKLQQPFLQATPVLDAYVSGWACLTARDGKDYIYFSYICTESAARPACVGNNREWGRLFSVQGEALTAKATHTGAATEAIMKQLGLERYLEEGISLTDAME